mmetsp:Transcript_37787/g.96576  ORF Transcript_37787/g.96576 Transcript_37787/m.96576 type:complete len:87 (-) Transcript_37787:17-277(-)
MCGAQRWLEKKLVCTEDFRKYCNNPDWNLCDRDLDHCSLSPLRDWPTIALCKIWITLFYYWPGLFLGWCLNHAGMGGNPIHSDNVA